MSILFLTLKIFSSTGGIEKVCRVMGKALYDYCLKTNWTVHISSMHDNGPDAKNNLYFPDNIFTGFGARKISFVKNALKKGSESDIVILSHINLLTIGWMIKKFSPRTKVILLTHGIEVWYKISKFKQQMLLCCDGILSVSNYTRSQVINQHNVESHRCFVLNNCIDPYLNPNCDPHTISSLKERYSVNPRDKILLTLTRLSVKEHHKGYYNILRILGNIKTEYPSVKYIIAGKYEIEEKILIEEQIHNFGLSDNVIITDYISDCELSAIFNLADIYVMPSKKEGFGIVFIEAMYYGVPVIAGNVDGSVDALLNGRLGLLVDPESTSDLRNAILEILQHPEAHYPDKQLLMENFSYETYQSNLSKYLQSLSSEKKNITAKYNNPQEGIACN